MAQVIFPAVVVPGSTADPAEPSSPSDGQIWVDTDGTAPTTVVTRWSKTPTNGTTTLSGTDDTTNVLAYTPGYEQVFLNGVLLSRGSDYTATTGTSVVLSVATITSDIVEIIAALQVAYTDTITTAAAATTYVAKALTTTTGDIIYASAANTPARLGIGTTGQVLNVASGIPAWTTASTGALTKISAQTFSGVSSVTFDSVFTSTYKVYFATMTNLIMSTSGQSNFQFRKAGTTTTASYYGSGIYLPFNYSGYEPVKHFNSNDSKITIFGADNRAGGGHFYASNVGSGAGDEPMIWGSGTVGFGFGGMQTFGGANGSATTDFDGFIISVTGTMSGTLTVYGVQA